MSHTSFGEFVRVLRIRHNELMGDMAEMLGVKVSFLSAVETGKKNVPAEWIRKIAEHYNLTEEKQDELREAVEESRTQYKIVTKDAGKKQRRAALQFARSFDKLDDETANKILYLLSKKEGKN
ncbi:MAG: helix-turn-helix domain-containing protein [Clostridia bacterium]|nr:helix-turn-helix domain-containing protein [Clostridia bacterium]